MLISGKVLFLVLPCCSDYARMVRNGWASPPALRSRLVSRESCAAVWHGAVFFPDGACSKFFAHCRTTASFLFLFCRCCVNSAALRLWAGCHGYCALRHLCQFLLSVAYFSFRFGPGSLIQVFLFFLVSLLITSVALEKSTAQMAAIRSQTQLSETLRTITEGFTFYRPDWTISYVNPAAARLYGSTVAEMTGTERVADVP